MTTETRGGATQDRQSKLSSALWTLIPLVLMGLALYGLFYMTR